MRAFIKEPWHIQGEAASVEATLRFEDKDSSEKKGVAMAIVTTPFMAGGM